MRLPADPSADRNKEHVDAKNVQLVRRFEIGPHTAPFSMLDARCVSFS